MGGGRRQRRARNDRSACGKPVSGLVRDRRRHRRRPRRSVLVRNCSTSVGLMRRDNGRRALRPAQIRRRRDHRGFRWLHPDRASTAVASSDPGRVARWHSTSGSSPRFPPATAAARSNVRAPIWLSPVHRTPEARTRQSARRHARTSGLGRQDPRVVVAREIRPLHSVDIPAEAALDAGSWEARTCLGLTGFEPGVPADLVVFPDTPVPTSRSSPTQR